MKLKAIKTEAQAKAAAGVDVELIMLGTTIKGVRIGTLHVTAGQYSGIEVSVETPYTEASRYKVTATVEGFPADVSYFDDFTAAQTKAKSYGDGVKVDYPSSQVKVLLDDFGKVVRELGQDEEEGVPF